MISAFTQKSQLPFLLHLAEQLKKAVSIQEKLSLLGELEEVKEFLKNSPLVSQFLLQISLQEKLVILSILAIGQGENIFGCKERFSEEAFKRFIDELLPIEQFYAAIGGIVGYHVTTLKLLHDQETEEPPSNSCFHPFLGIDISKDQDYVREATLFGIESMETLAEIYPVGGAADRLRLQDEKTGNFLPAAKLVFCGKNLLQQMIVDLQAREYLYFKLHGKQLLTPIAMMTSQEKDNNAQILSIFEQAAWFGRPKESFRFFSQPLVPTMDKMGNWCLQAPLQLLLKPGGHGVIWKVALETGIFSWLEQLKRKKAIVRQINNLAAGCDYGLLAFTGIGCKENKMFGFASCPRQIKTSEGINVLIEKREGDCYKYLLTNVEYCDFKKFNIQDVAAESESKFSKFSSNTNLLFVDLAAVKTLVQENPFPGMLVNQKKMRYWDGSGKIREEEVVRLESTMQNIADSFTETRSEPLLIEDHSSFNKLKTFLTYNQRNKTISPIKREFVYGSSLNETPEGCYLDLLKNARDLLMNHCHIQTPEVSDTLHFFLYGPSFIFLYHPALGPLYSIIGQKIRKGRINQGGELQLEIAEIEIDQLDLDGSLTIQAKSIMGHQDKKGELCYSNQTGRCTLKNVKIRNLGINKEAANCYWKGEIVRKEECRIVIHGNGEFYAESVTLDKNLLIEVADETKVTVIREDGQLKFIREELREKSWNWDYSVDQESQEIRIKKNDL